MKSNSQIKSVANGRAADKFVVRLPDGMREKVAEVARTSHRSMNSEIVARLEESLNPTWAPIADEQLETSQLSLHEVRLINHFRQMNTRQRSGLLEFVCVVSDTPTSPAANQ
ncbi:MULTISPECIES: Arc family DNA-binding protein [Stutzerimonas]|nr:MULTISPECIES: Arc family DNA-binding protein [Stutzerimonas]